MFENYDKIKRSQYKWFLDITPSTTRTYKLEGWGTEEANVSFNPQVERQKYIVEDNARTDHTGNEKQTSISKKTYKGEPVFEFINAGRDKLNYKTHILEVDSWNGTNGSYPAKETDGVIVITSYSGDVIEYDLYFDGDTREGTATINTSGSSQATFAENASL